MKKILSLLSVLTVGTLTTTSVVACANKPQSLNSERPFLYHLARNTNLGTIKKNDKTILNKFLEKNPNLNSNKLEVTNITDKTAIIKAEKNNANTKGSVKVTFNTTDSKDLQDLITIQNLAVSRNVINMSSTPQVTEQNVIDGINAANGLTLTNKDVTIKLSNPHSQDQILDYSMAKVTSIKGGHYQGSTTVSINKNLNLPEVLNNTDLGTIYLPQLLINNFDMPNAKMPIMAFLLEAIGDANPFLQQTQDLLLKVQSFNQKVITFDKTSFTIDSTNSDPEQNALAGYFSQKVTFCFKIAIDNRLSISDAIKNTQIKVPKGATLEEIKKIIIEENQAQLSKYSSEEIMRYLVVNLSDKTEAASVTVSWLPGSKQFLGHDLYSMITVSFFPELSQELPQIYTNVYFTPGIIDSNFKIKNQESGEDIFNNVHKYLKDKYKLANDNSADKIANFEIWYGNTNISNNKNKIDGPEKATLITIKIKLKTDVEEKYKADLEKLTNTGLETTRWYISNTVIMN